MYSLKELIKLQKRSVRNEHGVFLVEGKKIIAEAIDSGQEIVQIILSDSFKRSEYDFLDKLQVLSSKFQVSVIADNNAERLTSAKNPAGIFAVVKQQKITLEELKNKKLIAVFEDIKDPGNLGTMLRTADWFGADAVITTINGADPYNDKVLRSTMGSIFHIPFYVSNNLVNDLKQLKTPGFQLIVTRPESPTNNHQSLTSNLCIVMGNESLGTSPAVDALADSSFSIPGFGKAESLNVAVSFGIVMWEMVRGK